MSATPILPATSQSNVIYQVRTDLYRPEDEECAGVVPGPVEPLVLAVLEHSHEEEGTEPTSPREDHPTVQILTPGILRDCINGIIGKLPINSTINSVIYELTLSSCSGRVRCGI